MKMENVYTFYLKYIAIGNAIRPDTDQIMVIV